MTDGLARLDRYLAHTWRRSRIREDARDDCSQAVYLRLLARLGPGGFASLLADLGRGSEAFSKHTPAGRELVRAIWTVKKALQRERSFLPIHDCPDPAHEPPTPVGDHDALDRLRPREREVALAALAGLTLAETAQRMGVSAKTVSNLKSEMRKRLAGKKANPC